MNNLETAKNEYNKKRKEIFYKYFKDKSTDEGLYNILNDCIFQLSLAYTRCLITYDCIEVINNNCSSDENSEYKISDILISLKFLCEELESIIIPIAESMK